MFEIKYLNELITDIKSKKELRSLDEDFIEKKLYDFFEDIHDYQYKHKVIEKLLGSKNYVQFKKSREYKYLLKRVRAELRKVYGAFILKEYEKKNLLLEKLSDATDLNGHIELLKLHKSTNERLGHYKELYSKIFSGFQDKIIILDIACGLNPIASVFIRDKIKKYYASDISSKDCDFLKAYFLKVNMAGTVIPLDLLEESSVKKLSLIKCDVCLIFKALDGLERVKKNITEKLFKAINAKIIAVTFPTLSLSGVREIKEHRRLWLELLLKKLGWEWEKYLFENELLYLIKKK